MALRTILDVTQPALNKTCRPVEQFDQRLWDLLDDMKETMVSANGVGLAAPQVGILRRVVVIAYEEYQFELINPVIMEREGQQTDWEGCLSLPGKYASVTRPTKMVVRAQDRNGNWMEYTPEGFLACVFSHEIDHLDGVTIDKIAERLVSAQELDELMEQEREQEETASGNGKKRISLRRRKRGGDRK